jgi:hypothetical protein
MAALLIKFDKLSSEQYKMANVRGKAQCVAWLIETKSDIQVQKNFRTTVNKDTPSSPSIRRWHKNFVETGSVSVTHHSGRPKTSEENVELFQEEAFLCCCSEIPEYQTLCL